MELQGAFYFLFFAAKSCHVLGSGSRQRGPSTQGARPPAHLFVHELSGVLFNVALIEVGGHAHEPDLGQAEVSQLDVAKRGDEQAAGKQVTRS